MKNNTQEASPDRELLPLIIITSNPDGKNYWSEFWRSRELLGMMVWRDIIVRYKQTALGLSWALMRPLAMMLVFSLIFGRLAHLPSNGAPYPLMVFAGLLPWLFFSSTFSDASNSVIGNANLVSKVYFPRLIIPLTSVLVGLVDFMLALLVYLVISFFYGLPPKFHVIILPLFLLQLCLLILGCSLWVAAMSVWYRDFRHLLPVVLQLGVYLSPVGFSSTVVPDKWRHLYAFNPMVGIIDGFRWSLLGNTQPMRIDEIGISCMVTLLLLWSGLRFFRRNEHRFSDAI